jgi:adenylate cyclase
MPDPVQSPEDAKWRHILLEGRRPMLLLHTIFRHLPSAPRCKGCYNPFGGIGGRLVGLLGFTRSRKNPNLCAACCERLPAGGAEVDIGVLFADVRGSTAMGSHLELGSFAATLNRFYTAATKVLVRHDAIIDKSIAALHTLETSAARARWISPRSETQSTSPPVSPKMPPQAKCC